MLSELVKSRIRYHLGVPAAGIPQTGSVLGYRFNPQVGSLEYRMLNLQPAEEVQITGNPLALVMIAGVPRVGDTPSLQINSGAAIQYTVTSQDLAAAIPVESISLNWAQAITLSGQGYLGDYGIPPNTKPTGYQQFYQGTLIIDGILPTTNAFNVTVTSNGGTVVWVAQQGVQSQPQVTFSETNQTVYGYVAICDYLESRIANAADLIKYAQASGASGAGVRFRPNELAERQNVYDNWCQKLAEFFGIQRFPMGKPAAMGAHAFTGDIF